MFVKNKSDGLCPCLGDIKYKSYSVVYTALFLREDNILVKSRPQQMQTDNEMCVSVPMSFIAHLLIN